MAHGLMLRMKDMLEHKNERPPDVKNLHYPTSKAINSFLDEVHIIQSWLNATRYPENSRIEYFTLLRQTLMFIFSRNWDSSPKKEDLLRAYADYCRKFSTITPNCVKVHNAVMKIAEKPWKNPFFAWETLFNETTAVEDVSVACYFAAEPEEILLARVHSLVIQGHTHAGFVLSKMSFMYRCRVKGQLSGHQRTGSSAGGNAVGHASIDWYAFLLQKTKTLPEIISEVQKWKCHEGIEILYRLQRDPKNIKFCCTIITVLLIEHLKGSKDSCCTKKLFVLYCKIHKEMNSSLTEFTESARKIFANYAPTSSHMYLFVDVVWSQYGIKCLDLYIELYVRGLTADLNHLEASESSLVPLLETHLATMFEKLSTLFSGFLDIAARECMFSAFSLRPTKERLYILQSLTQNLLSGDNNKIEKSTSSSGYETVRYCDCRLKCTGPCRMKMKNFALNPLLNLGVKSVSYHLIKDLVCVLESARSIRFQYNMFDWQSNITELSDYLKASGQSENELKEDSSVVGSSQEVSDFVSENTSTSLTTFSEAKCSVKRKSVSEPCALDVAANVEIESLNKRIKVPSENTTNQNSEASQQYPSKLATENARSESMNESQQTHRNSVFSEVNRESPVSHTVYPYSLTDRGKQENFSTPQRMSSKSSMNRLKSSVESQTNLITTYTNTSQPIVSPPSVSYSRQSVVISSANNIVANKSVLPDSGVSSAMPYSVQSSTDSQMYSQVRESAYQNIKDSSIVENALNLSCSSEFQRFGGTGNFSSQSSTSSSSQSTNSPNSTHLMLVSSKRQECHDRNSVIHHTMQHIRENSIPISREIVVSLDAKTSKRFKQNSDLSSCHNVANKPEHPTFENSVRHSFSHNNLSISHRNSTSLPKPEIFNAPSNFIAVKNNKKLQVAKIANPNDASIREIYKPYPQSVSVSKPQTDLQSNTINTTYDSMYESQTMKHQTLAYQDSSYQRPSTQSNYQKNYVNSSSSQNYHLSNTNTSSNYQQHGTSSLPPSVNQSARPNRSLLRATPQQKIFIHLPPSQGENVRKSMSHPLHLASHKQQPTYIHSSNSALNNTSSPSVPSSPVPSIATANTRDYSRNSMPILKSHLSPSSTTTSASANRTYIHPSLNSAEGYGTSPRRDLNSFYTQQSSTLPHSQASATGMNSYSATSLTQSFSRPANQTETLEQPYALPHSQALSPGINYSATSASQSFNRHSNQAQSTYNHDMYSNPIRSTEERGVVFHAGNADSPLNYSPSPVGSSQKVCCSPHEVKPCQSCSPSEKSREQQYDFSTAARNPYPETGITFEDSVECPVTAEESGDPEILCHFCAFAFSASLMDEHLKEYHQKELTSRKNRQTKKDKDDMYLTDSNTPSTKPEKHRDDFDERIDIETSKVTPPMQLGKNTLLHNSSLQSLPDNNSFAPGEIIFCSLCNIKLLSGAEFESHMTSCHSKLDEEEIYQSTESNEVCAQPTPNFAFSSLMSEDLHAEVYSCLESNNQQGKDDVSQTTNKSLKVKKQLKCPTEPCKYCGKILTDKYMKTHYQKMHKEIYKALDSGSNQEKSSLEIKNTNSDIQSVSTLLQEDIACLSPSDALNVGERFGIVAPEHVSPSDSSIKTENTNINPLSKSKSKFKSINKSLQLTLKENASLKGNDSKDTIESAQSKNYRCQVCFRIYTTKSFLTRHLLNYHKISTNTSNESSTVGQEPSLINQLNSTYSDIEQNGKSLVQNDYELSANEISGLHASNNSKKISNGSRDVDQVETASFEQVSFNNSTSATHSIDKLSESNMTNPNLNPDGNPTKVANVKKPRPKNFKCSMCPKAFAYSKLLEKHKAKLHPNSSFLEHNKTEPQNCESTFLISNQQMDKTGISQNMDQLLVEQTLQHHESATHKTESYFNMPMTTENTLNNNYSSSNLSDKVSLSKSDSFFHSSVCSSDDFMYEKNFCDNGEQKDSGSYSKQNSIETFNINQSSSSIHFPSSYSTYSKNVEQGTDEQNGINHAQMNFNENDVACKSTLFTEMLRDSEDTSLPYQTSSCNSRMPSLPHAVYQQSVINLEASSVSTESNECPVCFKKMSTQDQLRHHIEKLHPSSVLDSAVQEDDKQIDSKFNSMFTELQHAYSVINSTESCENEPIEVEENNFKISYQKDTQELSFTPGMTSSPLKREEKQEKILTAFCNNFGNSTSPSSLKSLHQNEQEESKRNYTSLTFPKTEPLVIQASTESAVREVSSSASLAGQDANNLDPIVLTDNSSALKHAWMFSDLLEEFEAQTGPTSEHNKAENEKCEALSLKNNVNIQVNFQATTTTGSSLMDNYLTSKPEILSEHDTLKESSKLDAEINNDFNLTSEDAFLSKESHSVRMNDIFSDKFLGTHSDFIPLQVISTSEQDEENDHLFSSDIKYASYELDNQNKCEVEAEKMGQLFESEEIAKQISFLLNSGNESPNHDLMNITAPVSPGKDNFLPKAEESSFLNHTAGQGMILTGSENPPTEFSVTEPPTASPKKPNFQSKKKHKCEICSKEFGGAWHLTRHLKSVHSGIHKFSETTIQKISKINKATLDIKKNLGILSPPARSEIVTLQTNSNNNVKCTTTVKTPNMVPVVSISGKTFKIIPEPSMNSDLILPAKNILPKRKPGKRNPCKCPECPRILCSSDSLRRHIRNLHPGCPLPTSSKILRPSTSIPAPVMQNLTESGTSLIEKQNLNTFNNAAIQPIDKASVNPSVSFQTFSVSSTNLFDEDIDIGKNISLNERKESFHKKVSVGTACKDFETSTVSDYVGRTISTIANEIRLESLNKCARNIVKDQKSGSINSKSINEIASTNAVSLPSIDNKHRLQLSINNNNLRTFQSNSQILLIKCPSDVRFSGRPSETVRTLSDFTNSKVKSEPLVTLPDNVYQPNRNTVEHQAKIDSKFTSSEKKFQNCSVNSIKTKLSSCVQVIGLSTTGRSLSLKKKTKKVPAPKAPVKVKRFLKPKVKVSSDFLKNSEKCRFCHKVFRSIETLSYHLKVIHKSKFAAASATKCAAKTSPNLSQDTSIQSASVPCSNSQASDTKNFNKSFSASSPTPEVSNDQKANLELANIKIELDNEVQTKSQFHEEDDSIAKRRSRRNDECEIVYEKPGTSSFLSTKCLPKKLNCISRKKYRNYSYSKLIKPKIKLSSNQKGPDVINIASPVKNSSIPKCVIKVSDDGKYKIDKSPNYIKTGKAKFQFSKRRFCNGIAKVKQQYAHVRKRKLFTGLSTNIRGRRPLKSINLSSIANSKIKKNRISIKNAAKQGRKIAKKTVPRQIKSYKRNCRNLKNSSTETFRDSKEIKRFLFEHKQPIVVLERLPNKFLNNPPYLVENLPKQFFDFKAKPIVRLKRLNSFSLPNSLSLIKNCYVKVEKLKNSESISFL